MTDPQWREVTSFCRICTGGCGTRLWIDGDNRIAAIRPDEAQSNTRGYACSKGMQAEDAHHSPARLLRPLKRQPDGSFVEIALEQALDEIAARLWPYAEGDDRDAIAIFKGNAGSMASAAYAFNPGFLAAIGSRSYYTATTIDQPNKMVSFERLGGWRAGLQGIAGSDVALLFGTNPVLSHSCGGFLFADPARRLKASRQNGLKLIVVDPRVTETARQADIHLQSIPGQDAAIAGALIRIILDERWDDQDFTRRFATPDGMAALRAAVHPLTEAYVEERAGLEAGQLRRTAEMFARDASRGAAYTATGPSMAPFGSLAQHLINCLNVICGRYRRAGDPYPADPTRPAAAIYEEAISPPRNYRSVPPSRIRGVGILGNERLTATLPDEILTPGKGQIRCLFAVGSNPVASIPDTSRVQEALRALDLLVAIVPYMTVTASEAHYILPPLMQYERADLQLSIPGVPVYADSWGQYTPAVIGPPTGSELCDEWYPFWAIAKRLGLAIDFPGAGPVCMDQPPTTDDLLALRMKGARISLDELKSYPSGHIWHFDDAVVLPERPGQSGRFDLMPDDVANEMARYLDLGVSASAIWSNGVAFTHLLSCRRMRHVHCTVGVELASTRQRSPFNPLYLHPDDMAALGAGAGDTIEVRSDSGMIRAIAEPDKTMRPGCISIAFGWGDAGIPGAPWDGAANVNLLVSNGRDVDPMTALPRMSAIPVNLRRLDHEAAIDMREDTELSRVPA